MSFREAGIVVSSRLSSNGIPPVVLSVPARCNGWKLLANFALNMLLLMLFWGGGYAALAQEYPVDTAAPGTAATAEQSLIRLQVRHLSETMPVCLAYVIPKGHPPDYVADNFRFALKMISAELKKTHQRTSTITMSYSSRDAVPSNASSARHAVIQYTRARVQGRTSLKVINEPRDITASECAPKPTILFHASSVAFYSRGLPTATVWGGSISPYDVVLIKIH